MTLNTMLLNQHMFTSPSIAVVVQLEMLTSCVVTASVSMTASFWCGSVGASPQEPVTGIPVITSNITLQWQHWARGVIGNSSNVWCADITSNHPSPGHTQLASRATSGRGNKYH